MFEDSTFESTGSIHTRSKRWMLATLALNGSVLVALILIPLIYPEALPSLTTTILMTAPAPPVEERQPRPVPVHTTAANTPSIENIQAPPRIPTIVAPGDEPREPGPINIGEVTPPGTGTGSADNPWSEHLPVVVVQQASKTANVSSGVMNGYLIYKKTPTYPPIALQIRIEGTVVLQATISKGGTIENLRVLSGPAMLQQAAIDAVQQWRYRPYLLNGQPVDVETTVNVVFKMN
jgi:protein TonB